MVKNHFFNVVNMPYTQRRHCPICGKPDLLKLSNHLSQAHQLTSEDRQPWLKAAVFSATPCHGAPYMTHSQSPEELQRTACPMVTMPSHRPLCLEPQPYPEFTFQHMFSMMVVGPSQCGKTHFVQQLLTQNCIDFPEKKPRMVYWFYSQWQPSYEAIQRALQKKIRFAQGLPELKDDLSNITLARNNILVLDDLMSQATDSPVVSKLFTQGRHRNASVILLLQNMFPKGKYNTDISRNATYKVLFRSPGDRKQIDIITEQTFAEDRPHFMKAYTQETEQPYGYIIVDNHPRTTGKRQVVANVFGDCQSYPVHLTEGTWEERSTVTKPTVQQQTTVPRQGSKKRVQPTGKTTKKRQRVQSTGKTTQKRKRVQSAVKPPSAKRSRKLTKTPTRKSKKPAQTPRTPYQPWKTFQEADSEEGYEEDSPYHHYEEDDSDPSEDHTEETWDSDRLNQLASLSDEERDSSEETWHYPQNRLIARPRPQGGFGPRIMYE